MKIIKNNQYGFGLIESFLLTLLILVIGFGIYKVFNNQMNKSNDSAALTRTKSDTPSLDNSSSNQITSGEILNTKGTRRPANYIHICETNDDITYVTQGYPNCNGTDSFGGDYDSSAPGVYFSSPCETTSMPVRYLYISNSENCPSGSNLVFYNTL